MNINYFFLGAFIFVLIAGPYIWGPATTTFTGVAKTASSQSEARPDGKNSRWLITFLILLLIFCLFFFGAANQFNWFGVWGR